MLSQRYVLNKKIKFEHYICTCHSCQKVPLNKGYFRIRINNKIKREYSLKVMDTMIQRKKFRIMIYLIVLTYSLKTLDIQNYTICFNQILK